MMINKEEIHEILMNLNRGRIAVSEAEDQIWEVINRKNCRRCGQKIGEVWKGWELCDHCGYRYNIETNISPDAETETLKVQ